MALNGLALTELFKNHLGGPFVYLLYIEVVSELIKRYILFIIADIFKGL